MWIRCSLVELIYVCLGFCLFNICVELQINIAMFWFRLRMTRKRALWVILFLGDLNCVPLYTWEHVDITYCKNTFCLKCPEIHASFKALNFKFNCHLHRSRKQHRLLAGLMHGFNDSPCHWAFRKRTHYKTISKLVQIFIFHLVSKVTTLARNKFLLERPETIKWFSYSKQ